MILRTRKTHFWNSDFVFGQFSASNYWKSKNVYNLYVGFQKNTLNANASLDMLSAVSKNLPDKF